MSVPTNYSPNEKKTLMAIKQIAVILHMASDAATVRKYDPNKAYGDIFSVTKLSFRQSCNQSVARRQKVRMRKQKVRMLKMQNRQMNIYSVQFKKSKCCTLMR